MDYCHPCRRHLNGALACPGCGTPAEACRRYAEEIAAAEAVAAGTAEPHRDEPGEPRRSRRAAGRARRRDTERRRRRTRALVVGAGFLLVAGGVGAAKLGGDGEPEDRAAPARPDAPEGTDVVHPTQTAAETGRADRGDREPSSPAPATPDAPTPTPTEAAPKKSGNPDRATESPDGQPSSRTPSSQRPPAQRPTPPPRTRPADPDPETTPEPTPSESCDRFLWWCT
ncbi:hypothetical protein QIS99_28445 [Streptomyces sp. B-S-A8]|uniref:Zinc ribbon domain-containing protein n=1 Tax=Streptomyces solicavernae TaxID=3043614 RepID=A0ABT6S068_9ACTN|nr:hypothetical protein [Streptomyces sp. B-S-A8]MDI3390091.1 hypothetical protein [Streptomyces sp. B-S-A8]